MATMTIQTEGGQSVRATYVRHLRTLTPHSSMGGHNRDLDLFRLTDGREVVAESPADDARATPVIRDGLTPDAALFIE